MIPIRGARATHGWPWMTIGLIAVNVAVFLYQLYIGPKAANSLFWQKGAVAAKLSQPHLLTSLQALKLVPTVFISLFLHANWLHLLGNMWFLWVFGEGLEDDLGHWRFLAFYICCGLFACIFHVWAAWKLTAPMIGASGAIAGVLGGYLRRLPRSSITTAVFWRLKLETHEYPAVIWLALWVALQFYGLRQGGAVAWMAHLGGFLMGLLAVNLFTTVGRGDVKGKAAGKKSAPAKKKRR